MTGSDDLLRRIAKVGGGIDPALSDRDVERLVAGGRRRGRRRIAARVVLGAAAAGAAAIVLGLRSVPAPGGVAEVASAPPAVSAPAPAPVPTPAPVSAPAAIRLGDGSVATPLDASSTLAVRDDSARHVAMDLTRGRGRFEVAPRPERRFSVHAGDVTVTALGTVFTVERVADRIGVGVEHGRVRVEWRSGTLELGASEHGWFPPLQGAEPAQPIVATRKHARADVTSTPEPTATATPPPMPPTPMATAPTAPPPVAPTAPATVAEPRGETAEWLLAAADTARVAGRPGDGAALLRRVLDRHRADPRAPLAAFTLGRVLLMELGQPRQAAAAFAEARALAPAGPFAEDALAREVEALSKAGDKVAAHTRAQEYQRLYPSGRRTPAVRALGGGE